MTPIVLGHLHKTIGHNLSEYSVNGVLTNGIEPVWAEIRVDS
jgi:hypothetical protein